MSLPPGWTSAIDPSSGRLYYANPVTGESSWEFPSFRRQPEMHGRFVPPEQHQQPVQQHHHHHHHHQQQQQQQQQQQHREPRSIPRQQQQAKPSRQQQAVPSGPKKATTPSNKTPARFPAELLQMAHDNPLGPLRIRKHPELYRMTSGKIADLHSIQKSTEEDGTFEPYLPIYHDPYRAMPNAHQPVRTMETARLDTRIHSLYEKLKKIQK